MRTTGTVREWHDEDGWGVIDSPDTPGGCWAHFSVVELPTGHLLRHGAPVLLDVEEAAQVGYDFRATWVWAGPTTAYASGISIDVPVAPVRVFRADQLIAADPTPGMDRRRAFEVEGLWAGQVVTAPGAVSGWHHHDRNESSLYVVRGVLRLEFEGHDGHVDAGPGDFVHVPAWTVHRESNPTDQPSLAVIARAGGGIPTVNVGGPPPPYDA